MPTLLATVVVSTMLLGFQVQNAFAANALPIIEPIPDQIVDELTQLTFNVTASDPDGQTVTLSLDHAPYGSSFNPATGIFTWTPSEEQGSGIYVIDVVASDGFLITSETVMIIVNDVGGGGTGGAHPRLLSSSSPELDPATLGETGLYADPTNIPLDGTTSLTQLSDGANNGELMSLTVLEPDGDVCAANGVEASIPSEGITKEYPSDFALMSNGGDGLCDTGDVGVYHAQSQVSTNAGTVVDSAEFETDSPFVLPESPIGMIALMASSLAVLSAFLFLKNRSAGIARGI
ncbi:MAG: Ig domain-containing protein [Nitrososphaera sp.]|nr:Ig domain-containing protein [Nitrososphaera sp.]